MSASDDQIILGLELNPLLGIMEGAAILSYLTRHFDPDHKFSFTKDPELSLCEQWVAWQHGGLGPVSYTARKGTMQC